MRLWVNNTDGEPDAVLTLALVGFLVIVLKLLFAESVITIGQTVLRVGAIDAATITAVLVPTLGAYVARRYTDRRYGAREVEDDEDDTE